MCLSVIGKIEKLNHHLAYVNILGLRKWISVELIEEVQIGDEVLIHAGCAISKLTSQEANDIKDALESVRKGNAFYYGKNDSGD